jgi:hypothetical protein
MKKQENENEALNKTDVSGSALRFIIVDESLSAHCCFDYTIVDTHFGKEDYGDYWKKTMCECFDKEEAENICQALNKHYA